MSARLRTSPHGSSSNISRERVPRRWKLLRVLFVGSSASTATSTATTPPATTAAKPVESAATIGSSDTSDSNTAPAADVQPGEVQVPPRTSLDGFDDFYRSQYPSVTRLAFSLCGSMAIAEELAQEAFVAAHRRWRRVAAFDRPDLWVRRVVINRSISYRRKLASERKALQRVSERPHSPDSLNEPVLADDAIWQAMRELSGRQAEVLALVYVEDQPIASVAAILGLGEETVRTHLKRGRAALAAKLADRRSEVTP